MNITITGIGRHVFQISGAQASGKTSFMDLISDVVGCHRVTKMTGDELENPFAYQQLESKEILLVEELAISQLEELNALVSTPNIVIRKNGMNEYKTENTLKYIFYTLKD